jgi:quercetin dioxygenase-like cupin family protein
MAKKNKIITNPVTGQTIRFIQTSKDTDGTLLEMESTLAPYSTEPLPHFHPVQLEEFIIMQGSISVRINGKKKILQAGEKLTLFPNTHHSMWNHTGEKAVVNWKVQPALETEKFFETAMGLAADGKVNKKGMPSLLQTSLLVSKYKKEYRLSKPSLFVQSVIFCLLMPIAKWRGYKSVYPSYLD